MQSIPFLSKTPSIFQNNFNAEELTAKLNKIVAICEFQGQEIECKERLIQELNQNLQKANEETQNISLNMDLLSKQNASLEKMINEKNQIIKGLESLSASLKKKMEELSKQLNATKEQINSIEKPKCIGHVTFLAHYTDFEKAKLKASEKVAEYVKNKNIDKAIYKIIERGTPEGERSGRFRMLNSVYKYAVEVIYFHNSKAKKCEYI